MRKVEEVGSRIDVVTDEMNIIYPPNDIFNVL